MERKSETFKIITNEKKFRQRTTHSNSSWFKYPYRDEGWKIDWETIGTWAKHKGIYTIGALGNVDHKARLQHELKDRLMVLELVSYKLQNSKTKEKIAFFQVSTGQNIELADNFTVVKTI